MKISFFTALVASLLVVQAVAVRTAQTCSCKMPSSIQSGFGDESAPVFKAVAKQSLPVNDKHYTYTLMDVKVTFRGCSPSTDSIIVRTPSSAAACGVTYTPGLTYAVTAKLYRSSTPPPGVPATVDLYTATSCSYNKEWNACPYDDKVFLYYTPPSTC